MAVQAHTLNVMRNLLFSSLALGGRALALMVIDGHSEVWHLPETLQAHSRLDPFCTRLTGAIASLSSY